MFLYMSVSLCTGDVISQHALQVVSQHALQQVSRRGVSRPTPKGEVEGSGLWGSPDLGGGGSPGPHPGGSAGPHQEGVYLSMHWGRPPDGYCCGWYASYWNAFLFVLAFHENIKLCHEQKGNITFFNPKGCIKKLSPEELKIYLVDRVLPHVLIFWVQMADVLSEWSYRTGVHQKVIPYGIKKHNIPQFFLA